MNSPTWTKWFLLPAYIICNSGLVPDKRDPIKQAYYQTNIPDEVGAIPDESWQF